MTLQSDLNKLLPTTQKIEVLDNLKETKEHLKRVVKDSQARIKAIDKMILALKTKKTH